MVGSLPFCLTLMLWPLAPADISQNVEEDLSLALSVARDSKDL